MAATRAPVRPAAAGQATERARQRGQRRVEGGIAAVDRMGGGLDAQRVGHGVGHRALQRCSASR
jgi:hypothetical protein